MPIQINFLENGAGIEFISSGIVTGKEIMEANRRVYTPENLRRLRYKIIDRTTCTEYRVSARDIETIARQDREAAKINSDITIVLVSSTSLQYGMTRMWQAYAGGTGFQSEIFRDRAGADAFIQAKFHVPDNDFEDEV